jgi:hypothetical protein
MASLSVFFACLQAAPAAAEWKVAREPDPLTNQARCLIRSDTITLQDGYGDTPVTLVGNGQQWVVVTQSELDTGFADLEVVVDNNPPIKAEKIERNNVVVFTRDYSTLLEQFKPGRKATVYLRFWPTWPATQRFLAEFSLIGFAKAFEGLANCR